MSWKGAWTSRPGSWSGQLELLPSLPDDIDDLAGAEQKCPPLSHSQSSMARQKVNVSLSCQPLLSCTHPLPSSHPNLEGRTEEEHWRQGTSQGYQPLQPEECEDDSVDWQITVRLLLAMLSLRECLLTCHKIHSRFRPGTVALREIRRYQQSTELLSE